MGRRGLGDGVWLFALVVGAFTTGAGEAFGVIAVLYGRPVAPHVALTVLGLGLVGWAVPVVAGRLSGTR